MSHPAAPKSLADLNNFSFYKVLNEDPFTHSLALLGTLPNPHNREESVNAIVRIEKTALSAEAGSRFFGAEGIIMKAELEASNDIYGSLSGWFGEDRERDVKINVICPATDVHIRKYTKQEHIMVRETPALYEQCVKPYIDGFPASRTQWVENILTGLSEQSQILYSSSDFLILPDMKWDLQTISSLYLVAIVRDHTLRSLRDLRRQHLDILESIRDEANRVVQEKWKLGRGSLRMYIHYQPSYYHFHVHIVNANYQGNILGMSVGQAHLLDDVISLLELDPENGPGVFQRMTLTYGLGDQHGLFQIIRQHNITENNL